MSGQEWYFTTGFVPLCVTTILWPMRCYIPVVPGGDGADTEPLEVRTARCHHPTTVLVGAGPTCGHHLKVVFQIGGIEPRRPIPECAP